MAKWTTTRNAGLAVSLALAAATAVAQQPAFPRPSDQDLLLDLPDGASLETRRDGDINGDGVPDLAFVGRTEDARWLVVKIGYKEALDWGFEPASVNKGLDPYPLGAASLAVKKDVLVVGDLTGGTTATMATYRYRWDPQARRMRLIGLDATTYSRTNSHDSIETSWNLLTGAHSVVRGILVRKPQDDDAAYRYTRPDRTVRKSPPVYMEDTPDPAGLVEAEVVPAGEDRD
jgi:hypothetical protein